ncbi:NPCBM/NEW2 domain-containing protein [Streptomyces sp. DH37]|uniref:NPCBM/NEW2 domain-containing protein n=1 Tax=Streptomyces sp. DH37 TaxID=3040122 RepID=UPI002442CCE9|nr:NPCBM/NEW2 domain-containing protein [Streptomyces sp. DH37]MDG9702063.1 NPCBM/NEW2 domain-containing protein [Streptomyces sp. DH37]
MAGEGRYTKLGTVIGAIGLLIAYMSLASDRSWWPYDQAVGDDRGVEAVPSSPSPDPSPEPSPSEEPSPTPDPTAGGERTGERTGEPSAGVGRDDGGAEDSSVPDAGPSPVQYLSDIEGTRDKSATLVLGGRQRQCLNSLMIAAHLFQDTKTLEYSIDPGWDAFRAVAGIDTAPPAGNRMRFTVFVDGRQAAVHELSDREAVEIEVPVAGKSQLKLVTETLRAGKVPKGGYGAWGDARFTRGADTEAAC